MPAALATTTRTDPAELFTSLLPWLLLLLGLVILAAIVIAVVRRMSPDEPAGETDPFTLQGLRDMRSSGQITEEEFQRMKAAIIDRLQSRLREPEEPDPKPGLDLALQQELEQERLQAGDAPPPGGGSEPDATPPDPAPNDGPDTDDHRGNSQPGNHDS